VLCIQETKVQDPDFPKAPLEKAGYHSAYKGQKSYNGVAVLSKSLPDAVHTGFGDGDPSEEPRLITVQLGDIRIVNTYIPQGQDPASDVFQYKLRWFSRLRDFFESRFSPDRPFIWAGDFNVAPKPIDVHDPKGLLGSVGYHPDEHRALASVMDWGFVDVYRKHKPDDPTHTFWDYRIPNGVKRGLGWRVDHICATQPLAAVSIDAWIDIKPRLQKRPSDHTFIVAEFDLSRLSSG
jgi:exodeoxyribonuclease-3